MNSRKNTLFDPESFAVEELNEPCMPFKIGNLSYPARETLKEVDPTAFKEIVAEITNNLLEDGIIGYDQHGDYIFLKG